MIIQNTMQTNGTLLDDEWCEFFRENNFLIGLSLDGPRELHDAYRVDKTGRPTFDRVMKRQNCWRHHKVDYNILTTVHAANAEHPLEVYRFLRDEVKADFIQFIPIVERDNDTGFQEGDTVTDRSVKADQYGRFLISVFMNGCKRMWGGFLSRSSMWLWPPGRERPLGSAPSQRPAGRPWPWSTMGTCTHAIILWSRILSGQHQ